MAENTPPNPRPLRHEEEEGWKKWGPIIIIVVLAAAVGLLGWWWLKPSQPEVTGPSTETTETTQPASAVDHETTLNNIKDRVSEMTESVTGLISGMSNLVKSSDRLNGLVMSNQLSMLEMSQRLDNFADEMATNNASIRAEIPGIVEEKVREAMQPFRFLTNPPPPMITPLVAYPSPTPVVVTTPPITPTQPTAPASDSSNTVAVTLPSLQPSVALVTPAPVVNTNNNTVVVNIPPPPAQVEMTPPPSVLFQNNNTVTINTTLPPQPQQPIVAVKVEQPPYHKRDLWERPK